MPNTFLQTGEVHGLSFVEPLPVFLVISDVVVFSEGAGNVVKHYVAILHSNHCVV